MKSFAEYDLSMWVDRPVIDLTGLTGTYDFTLYWTPEYPMVELNARPGAEAAEPAPTLLQALQDQLGLKLEARKSSIEVIVIDHVEKIPTGN
jgi:uncharacterized protein (TIGR03435 family)